MATLEETLKLDSKSQRPHAKKSNTVPPRGSGPLFLASSGARYDANFALAKSAFRAYYMVSVMSWAQRGWRAAARSVDLARRAFAPESAPDAA